MSITIEQIELWRSVPSETQNLEFKEAKSQYDSRKLFKYCVALANEGGGHLVLGMTDRRPRQVVGSGAFPDLVGTVAKIFQAIGFRCGCPGDPAPGRAHYRVPDPVASQGVPLIIMGELI